MPNAKDLKQPDKHLFLVLGGTGSGKTTQFLTLPGRKFMYLFDPNAVNSVAGHDVEFEQFLPDRLNLAVSSLKKGVADKPATRITNNAYVEWERDFEKRLASGFFNDFDAIAFDSCTTLLDMIMDRVLTLNGRPGQWPNQDDYGPQMNTFTNIVRTATSLGKTVWFTGHIEPRKDEVTGRLFNTPLLTGRLKAKLPLLFSDIYIAEATADREGRVRYTLQTVPDRLNPLARCTVPGMQPRHNVTLDFSKPLTEQGLGALLQRGSS